MDFSESFNQNNKIELIIKRLIIQNLEYFN